MWFTLWLVVFWEGWESLLVNVRSCLIIWFIFLWLLSITAYQIPSSRLHLGCSSLWSSSSKLRIFFNMNLLNFFRLRFSLIYNYNLLGLRLGSSLGFDLVRNNSEILLIYLEVISIFIILEFIISYRINHASNLSGLCSLLLLILSLILGWDAILYDNRSWFLSVSLRFFSCSLRTRLLRRSC
jgi:hypothetical protein